MREIKFRVWDVNDKVFCYFDSLTFFTGDSESRMLDGVPRYIGKLVGNSQCFYKEGGKTKPIYNSPFEKSRYTIQQFTGLKDKNKVDIYEGDIIENENFIGVAVFINGSFCLDERVPKIPIFCSDDINTFSCRKFGCLYWDRVIGNIFENPELLK